MSSTSPLNTKIDRMLRDFCSVKEICLALRVYPQIVSQRSIRNGYRRYLITEEERQFLLKRRKESAP